MTTIVYQCSSRGAIAPRWSALVAFVQVVGLTSGLSGTTFKPHEFLQSRPAPNFYSGHTLPRLSRWSWPLSYDATVELADRWGYALELSGSLTGQALNTIRTNPTSHNARLVALARSDPERYPLAVQAYRPLLFGLAQMPAQMQADFYVRDSSGRLIRDSSTGGTSFRTISPIAPDSIYEWAARETAAPLAALQELAPISVVLSGGEDGLSVAGHSEPYWGQDPNVVRAKGSLSWYDFSSQRKAHYQQIISNAIYNAVPERDLFLYYHTDAPTHRRAFNNWQRWFFDYPTTQSVSDLANSSLYNRYNNTGWSGSSDMLTLALNSVAQQLEVGSELSYNWVSGGSQSTDALDGRRYLGFLKSLYNAGTIGGVAVDYSYPSGGFNPDIAGQPPAWLSQLEALSQVHASFSYLEKYLREGHLLPGSTHHKWSTDLPAYELTTSDSAVRVLARKLEHEQEWLVTAWAAEGDQRFITTQLPEVGPLRLLARPEGSIYLLQKADLGTSLRLLDLDGTRPADRLNMVSVTSTTGGLADVLGNNVVLDGENFTVAFTPQSNQTLVNTFLDGIALGPVSQFTLNNVQQNHTFHFQTLDSELLRNAIMGDINRDGVVNGRDLLEWQVTYATSAPHADLDHNQQVDQADLALWQAAWDAQQQLAGGKTFLAWQRAFGTATTSADLNGDGTVNGADLRVWQASYEPNRAGGLTFAVVPEPGGILLCLVAASWLGLPGRRNARCPVLLRN